MKSLSTEFQKLKQEIITEHNRIRTNPKSYIPILERGIKYFNGKIYEKPDCDYGVETKEGAEAYQEAISFLKSLKPISALNYDEQLSRGSQDHANEIGLSGSIDHLGKDGDTADNRVSKYIEWNITIGENIDFGGKTGEEVILSLLVDDGVPERGHRANLFNTKVGYIGVGIAEHTEFEICSVIDYVGEIIAYKDKKLNQTFNKNHVVNNKINNTNINLNKQKQVINPGKKPMNILLNLANKKEKELNKEIKKMNIKDDEDNDWDNDPDAPEGCVSCNVKVKTTKKGKKIIKTTIKTYTMENGDEEEVTLEDTYYED